MNRVAFLVQLPKGVSPGQRFRIEQYEPYLHEAGISIDTFPFIGTSTYPIWYGEKNFLRKSVGLIAGVAKRFRFLLQANQYDYIFVQRELMPFGPPFFEWVLAKLLRKRLILDFDDAIWMPDPNRNSALYKIIKQFNKTKLIARWSYKVSVGNHFLSRFACQYNANVSLIPTCVDTELRYCKIKQQGAGLPVIGWTGSHSTIAYLDLLVPVLQQLEQNYDFAFLVICDRKPVLPLRSLVFLPWNPSMEIDDLLQMDIGVMPLGADAWSEGKCGFKLIQYLALGIPAVASRVGVNQDIVGAAETGYLCDNSDDWYQALEHLLLDAGKRNLLGTAGRKKIEAQYSVRANLPLFLNLFN